MAVNDAHGHATGDLLRIEVAQRLERHMRADRLLARYRGDEFFRVTGGGSESPPVDVSVGRLRVEFDGPFRVRGESFRLGVSVGQALFPRDGPSIAALFDATCCARSSVAWDRNSARAETSAAELGPWSSVRRLGNRPHAVRLGITGFVSEGHRVPMTDEVKDISDSVANASHPQYLPSVHGGG